MKTENLQLVRAGGRETVSSPLPHDGYADAQAGDKQVSLADVEVQADQTEAVSDSAD